MNTSDLRNLQALLDKFKNFIGEDKRIEAVIEMVDEELTETENLRDESIRGDE